MGERNINTSVEHYNVHTTFLNGSSILLLPLTFSWAWGYRGIYLHSDPFCSSFPTNAE